MAQTRRLAPPELARSAAVPHRAGRASAMAQWGALAAICAATFVVLSDFMAVGVALPSVQKSLVLSFAQLQWVMEAFVVPLSAGVLAAGYVAARAGRRRVFIAGLSLLACGSLLAGLSPSTYALIGARVAQGMGAACLVATGAAVLTEVFHEAHGTFALAVWGTATGLAVAMSPLVGGAIDTYIGWRWIFLLGAVVSGLALVLGARTIDAGSPEVKEAKGSDWRGLALFTAGVAILVIGLVRTTTTLGGWAQSGVLACFGCSGLLLVAFVAVESVAPSPALDLSLFRRRTFTGSAVAAFGLSMAVLGPFIFFVLYLSYNLGYSTLSVGSHLLLLSGMTLVLLPLAVWLDRYLPVKVIICAGLALVGAGLWLMSRLQVSSGWQDLVPGLIVAGVGLELVNPRLASTAAAPAPSHARSTVAAARANSAFRQLGTATGVAVLGSVFADRITDQISGRIATGPLNGQGPQIAGLVLDGRTGAAMSATPLSLRAGLESVVQASFTSAMHQVFLIAAGIALASALLALSIRSSDVPRPEMAPDEVVPAAAPLATAATLPAQTGPRLLVADDVQPSEVQRGEVVPPELMPAEVVRAEVVQVEDGRGEAARPEAAPPGSARFGSERAGGGPLSVRVTRARDGSPLRAQLAVVGSGAEVVVRHWTGTDGVFMVPFLASGRYELVVQSLGYRPETVPVVVSSESSSVVELALVGMAHIYGSVSGARGGWLPGVLLTLADGSGTLVASTRTDTAGGYHFSRVPEGTYTVAAPACSGATLQVDSGPGAAVAVDMVFRSPRGENGTVHERPAFAVEKTGSERGKGGD